MTIGKKIKFLFYKFRNFTYFEIKPFHRVRFFHNHIRNTLFKGVVQPSCYQINIKDSFVISLRHRTDRRSNIKTLFATQGIGYDFYEGNFVRNFNELTHYFTHRTIQCLSHGALGCALSHIRIWELIASKEEGLYLIFEDDVILSDSFKSSLSSLTRNYPADCDIFYLGSRNNRLRDILHFTDTNYVRSFNPRMGAFAYALTPQGAQKILCKLIPINLICGGIDIALGILVRSESLIAYQFYPTQVVFHDNTFSSNIFNPSVCTKVLDEKAISDWPVFES